MIARWAKARAGNFAGLEESGPITRDEKEKVSHRGQALRKALAFFRAG